MLIQTLSRQLRLRQLLLVSWVAVITPALPGCSMVDSGKKKVSGLLHSDAGTAQDRLVADGVLKPMEGQDEYDAAVQLFKDEQFKQAEKAFKKITKKYEDHPIEEHAQFMLAECQFAQERYPNAQDSYNRLLSRYEGTRYLERSTGRLWTIARDWLDAPQEVQQSEIIQATGGEEAAGVDELERLDRPFALIPNFTNRKRPVFDTDGRALEALKSIWLNHPTGPLADDAVMLSAIHYYRTGDYLEAERFFDLLRENYPDSPHAANAYQFGAHVIQLTYQGAEYDGKGLDKASELIKSSLSLFPQEVDRTRLKKSLAHIEHEKARKAWERVQYRLRKGQRNAAEIACVTLLQEFPESQFAPLAEEQMEKLRRRRLEDAGIDPDAEQFDPDLPEYEEAYDDTPGEYLIEDLEVGEPPPEDAGGVQQIETTPDFSNVPGLFDNLP